MLPPMTKREELVRFGVAMEESLLRAFDGLVKQRGGTRSELLRDLARAEVTKERVAKGTDAVATVTIVYDHHVRGLTETLTTLQHDLGSKVRSTMHVHLDHAHCLEVSVLEGRATALRKYADRVFSTRGVKHGGIDMIAAKPGGTSGLHVHLHTHEHEGGHDHADQEGDEPETNPHAHANAPAPRPPKRRARRATTRAT